MDPSDGFEPRTSYEYQMKKYRENLAHCWIIIPKYLSRQQSLIRAQSKPTLNFISFWAWVFRWSGGQTPVSRAGIPRLLCHVSSISTNSSQYFLPWWLLPASCSWPCTLPSWFFISRLTPRFLFSESFSSSDVLCFDKGLILSPAHHLTSRSKLPSPLKTHKPVTYRLTL